MPTEMLENVFRSVVKEAYKVSLDVGSEVERLLEEGTRYPLTEEQKRSLLRTAVNYLRSSAQGRADTVTLENLTGDTDQLVGDLIRTYGGTGASESRAATPARNALALRAKNGFQPGPVRPTRRFHRREVPMNCGYVKTTDIKLWQENVRLDIHIGQFRNRNGRNPTSAELLDLMLSNIQLPGINVADEFKIRALADSIAINGVRIPPIIDTDGTLLDGNRRVTACYFILNSDEFDSEQKQKVEYLFVHQLTEHATDEDRESVIVSLNFEDDLKEAWPEYVKARKVYEEWQTMLALEPRRPIAAREREMKRELSTKFALGVRADKVNRYIRMVEWATEFVDYLVVEKEFDKFQVEHKADEYFQYFDELSKGATEGVAHALDQDEKLKKLIFDLLFQDKIKNFALIRNLRYLGVEDRDQLARAHDMPADEETEDYVEKVLTDARDRSREARVVGADQRIRTFVDWLEKVSIGAFNNPEEISTESLQRLLDALLLADRVVRPALTKRRKK